MIVSQISDVFDDAISRLQSTGDPGAISLSNAIDDLLFRFESIPLDELSARLKKVAVPRSAGASLNLKKVAPYISQLTEVADNTEKFAKLITDWSTPVNRGGIPPRDFAMVGRAIGVSQIKLGDSKSLIRKHILNQNADPARVKRLAARIKSESR